MDADFVLSSNAHHSLKEVFATEERRVPTHADERSQRLYVIPAFQSDTHRQLLPKTKQQLLPEIQSGNVNIFSRDSYVIRV
jgi:Glycosyl-transferase for dystroglycan